MCPIHKGKKNNNIALEMLNTVDQEYLQNTKAVLGQEPGEYRRESIGFWDEMFLDVHFGM